MCFECLKKESTPKTIVNQLDIYLILVVTSSFNTLYI